MNVSFKRLTAAMIAALGVIAAGASFAQESPPASTAYPSDGATPAPSESALSRPDAAAGDEARDMPTPMPRVSVKGTRSTTQTIPQYVDGTPGNIRALPFDPVSLERTITVATHPAALGNPEPPPVPFNLDTRYLGAPLVESRGGD